MNAHEIDFKVIVTLLIAAMSAVFLPVAAQTSAQQFAHIYSSSNGVSLVYNDGRFGLLNDAGELLLPINYQRIEPFSTAGTAAAVSYNPGITDDSLNTWGVIDRTGRTLVPFNNMYTSVLSGGSISIIDRNGKRHLLDQEGKPYIVPAGFVDASATDSKEKMIITNADGQKTLATHDGKAVIPGLYDEIVYYSDISIVTASGQDHEHFSTNQSW
ncbi:WG repeat-containing protein [Arsukibacterium sp.]|uniref:WG repeat-containing protein n=1 Tax=Arsukibacterium sp. TaxID=1977258 RepID=UPI002FDB06AC